MRTILITTLMVTLSTAAFPAFAAAQGNSAIDQYIEGTPGAGDSNQSGGGSAGGGSGGGSAGGGSGDGSAGGGGQALPQSSADALDAQGSSGQAAADLAQSTAPPASGEAPADGGGNSGGGDKGSGTDSPAGGDSKSRSRGDSKGNATSGSADPGSADPGSGGFGLGLPILLLAALIAAVVFTIVRRRRGPDQPSQAGV